MATTSSLEITYKGNCHCGRFRFRLKVLEITEVSSCQCSLCTKEGYLWLAPADGSYTVTKDDGKLVNYSSPELEHQFCGVCGTGMTGKHFDGPLKGKLLVNVRSLLDFNIFKLSTINRICAAETPTQPWTQITPPVHHVGSCHCKAVKFELLVPLSDLKAKEDNCSICVRSSWAAITVKADQVKRYGKENETDYLVGPRKWTGFPFCKTCGVHVFINAHGPPQTFIDSIPEERKEVVLVRVREITSNQPISVRSMDGINLDDIPIERVDEGTAGYELEP